MFFVTRLSRDVFGSNPERSMAFRLDFTTCLVLQINDVRDKSDRILIGDRLAHLDILHHGMTSI